MVHLCKLVGVSTATTDKRSWPKLPPDVNQDGGSRHLKFDLTAITRSLLHVLAQNLTRRLKLMPRKQYYLQIWLLTKSKMAAAAAVKFSLLAISWLLLHILAPNLLQGLKVTSQTHNHNFTVRFYFWKIQDCGYCHFNLFNGYNSLNTLLHAKFDVKINIVVSSHGSSSSDIAKLAVRCTKCRAASDVTDVWHCSSSSSCWA